MYQGYETNTTSSKPNQKRTRTQFFLNPKPIKGIEIYFRETLRTFSTIWTMKLMINKLYLKMQNIAIMDPTDESGISMDLNIFKDPRAQREMHILFSPLFKSMEDRYAVQLEDILKKDEKIIELETI